MNDNNKKCKYCDNLLGKKGALGMCNKHYIQYKRWGDPLHAEKKERATIDGYYRDGKTGRREHRIIYERYYGIKLSSEEVIHHINFIKTDNRIENLWKYPNASEHIKAHKEYERLSENIRDTEEIVFVNGMYIKRERERERERARSDRQTRVIGCMPGYEVANRIYDTDYLAPTIRCYQGGGLQPKFIEVKEMADTVMIKQATKDGYIECEVPGIADLNYVSSTTRRGRVQEGGADFSNNSNGEYP